jgi:hypothetical protein
MRCTLMIFFGYLKTLFTFIRILCVGGNFLEIVIVNQSKQNISCFFIIDTE